MTDAKDGAISLSMPSATSTKWTNTLGRYTATIDGRQVELLKGKRDYKIFINGVYMDELGGGVKHVQKHAEALARRLAR